MTVEACKEVLARKSKSFALAARLLPRRIANDAAVVYAFCRRADDAIDEGSGTPATLRRLRDEVLSIFSGAPQSDTQLAAFQEVAQRCGIPRAYVDELLDGMEMDVGFTDYASVVELLVYCHRVAGTVGLMMCHVMGVTDPRALRRAAHLGIAMQLTNICRDVAEDAANGRVYLPRLLGTPRDAVRVLLREADRYYASADVGIRMLPWRCALAVRTARHVYAAIGKRIAARGYAVDAGRAFVPLALKLVLLARSLFAVPRRLPPPSPAPARIVRFPDDVLPL